MAQRSVGKAKSQWLTPKLDEVQQTKCMLLEFFIYQIAPGHSSLGAEFAGNYVVGRGYQALSSGHTSNEYVRPLSSKTGNAVYPYFVMANTIDGIIEIGINPEKFGGHWV